MAKSSIARDRLPGSRCTRSKIIDILISNRSFSDRCNQITSRAEESVQLPESAEEVPVGQVRPPVGGGYFRLMRRIPVQPLSFWAA